MSEQKSKQSRLPDDGTLVTAKTFASIEYDERPEEVTGHLRTNPSPFGGLPQCFVDGVQVDPRTVKEVFDQPNESETEDL